MSLQRIWGCHSLCNTYQPHQRFISYLQQGEETKSQGRSQCHLCWHTGKPQAQQHLQLLALLQPVVLPCVVLPQAPPILEGVGVQLLQLLGGSKVDLKEPGGECRGCEAAGRRTKGQAQDRAMEMSDQDVQIPHPTSTVQPLPSPDPVEGVWVAEGQSASSQNTSLSLLHSSVPLGWHLWDTEGSEAARTSQGTRTRASGPPPDPP